MDQMKRVGILDEGLPCVYGLTREGEGGSELVVLLRELGDMLGYERGGYGLVQSVLKDWREEFKGTEVVQHGIEFVRSFRRVYGAGWWQQARKMTTMDVDAIAKVLPLSTKRAAATTVGEGVSRYKNRVNGDREKIVVNASVIYYGGDLKHCLILPSSTAFNLEVRDENGVLVRDRDFDLVPSFAAVSALTWKWVVALSFKEEVRDGRKYTVSYWCMEGSRVELPESLGASLVNLSPSLVSGEVDVEEVTQAPLETTPQAPALTPTKSYRDAHISPLSEDARLLMTLTFEETELHAVSVNGRPAWSAREVGRVLGYSSGGGRLVKTIMEDWDDELIPRHDFAIIEGASVRHYLSAMGQEPEPGAPPINKLMVLFEPGVHLVCQRTNKPVGKNLRRFLADQVLPVLARSTSGGEGVGVGIGDGLSDEEKAEAVSPARFDDHAPEVVEVEALSEPVEPQVRLAPAAAGGGYGELVLGLSRNLGEHLGPEMLDKVWRERRLREVTGLLQEFYTAGELSTGMYLNYRAAAVAECFGGSMEFLRPAVEVKWRTPTEIGRLLNASPQAVGVAITRLGLRGKEGYSKQIVGRRMNSKEPREVVHYAYNVEAQALIEKQLGAAMH